MGGRNLEVAALNVGGSEPVPDSNRPGCVPLTLDPLAGTNTSDLGIFEGSKDPGHERRRPGNIIVSHDSDLRLNLGQGLADLQSFVGNWSVQDTDTREIERICKSLEVLAFVVSSNEDQLGRLTGQDALE